ncbi:hypothetical protein [Neptunomonas phycophila]|uniref:hypothetical protein n=1 Tax=Neptunomonas phycophila TaxID=1572645 RepID=UPI000948D9A1|nr:hypothetical protein [Neptunomonas phycophila]
MKTIGKSPILSCNPSKNQNSYSENTIGNPVSKINLFITNWRTGELENWRTGELENWRTGELENWRTGELENWRTGEQSISKRE